MPPRPAAPRTPSAGSVDPYDAYSAHFTPSSHGAGDARVAPPVFDVPAAPRPLARPPVRPPAPMTLEQMMQSPVGRVNYNPCQPIDKALVQRDLREVWILC